MKIICLRVNIRKNYGKQISSFKSLKKGVGSGVGSGAGSIGQRYGSRDPHQNVTDPPTLPLQVCGVCQKSVRQDNYSAHMLLHQERQFRCDQCPMRFTRRPELQRHMRAHSADKLFECEVCSKG